MARGVNKVILVGRLGADPEVRYSANGTPIARFNLATNESVPTSEGGWEERTEWHRVVAFGKTAENCGNYLSKGRLVYIEGKLRTQQWEDNQGQKRYTTEVVARDVQFLGGQDDQGQSAQGASPPQRTRPQASAPPQFSEDLPPMPQGPPDEDIPF
ncbi:MAG: single-stranded DNA-binding protein [Syntrophobacteraceae bacterium]